MWPERAGRGPGRTAVRLRPSIAGAIRFRVPWGSSRRRSTSPAPGSRRNNLLPWLAGTDREDRARRLVPPYDFVQAQPQGFDVQSSLEPRGRGQVVERIAGLQLIEEPQPLLGERQRQRVLPVSGQQRRNCPGDVARSWLSVAEWACADRFARPGRPASELRIASPAATRRPRRLLMRVINWVASSEWPPYWKKLSWRPGWATPNTSLHKPARSSSLLVEGGS